MRLLSLVLIVILAVCVLWGALIFSGAGLIKYAVKFYSGHQIVLHDVKVTPRLSVSAGKVIFDFNNSLGISGVSRGIRLDWSFENTVPIVTISFGQTDLGNDWIFKKGSVKLEPSKKFDWSTVVTHLRTDGIEFQDKIALQSLDLNSEFNKNFLVAKNSSFRVDNAFSKFLDLSIPKLTGHLDEFSFDMPVKKQKNNFLLSMEDLRENSTGASVGKFQVTGKMNDGSLSLAAEALRVINPEQKLSVEKVAIDTSQKIENLDILAPIKIDFNDIKISDLGSEIKSAELVINDGFSRASVDISGQINRVNLVGNSMYIMALDSADFDAKFYTKQLESGLSLIGRGDMSFTAVPVLSLKLDANLELRGSPHIELCLIARCELENLQVKYQVDAGNSLIKGLSQCSNTDCNLKELQHRLITSDTNLVFETLGKTLIFNPFVLASLYSQVLTGKAANNGHELNF